jgi:hypothetical protein
MIVEAGQPEHYATLSTQTLMSKYRRIVLLPLKGLVAKPIKF